MPSILSRAVTMALAGRKLDTSSCGVSTTICGRKLVPAPKYSEFSGGIVTSGGSGRRLRNLADPSYLGDGAVPLQANLVFQNQYARQLIMLSVMVFLRINRNLMTVILSTLMLPS